ncbi:MAG: hypothetical protein G01um101419_682 [Parcubacteria group bacterium Gr01-1014_19]|nr:MAG: hypothetical protein G01um101419_682 [Parcubacteria group bacterium Gr01-1014_19]
MSREDVVGLQYLIAVVLTLVAVFKFFVVDKCKLRSGACAFFMFSHLLAFSGELMYENSHILYLVVYAFLFCSSSVAAGICWSKEQAKVIELRNKQTPR